MKTHLFYTFLVIFAATALVTLLGVTGVITIREGYLTALVSAFLIELAAAVIAIFKGADFFASEKGKVTAEEKIWNSIRKMDSVIGYLADTQRAQAIHFQSRLLQLTDTPRTEIMYLVLQIQHDAGNTPPEAIKEALGAIAEVLETGVHIGSSEKANIVSLCKSLPTEFAGATSRLLQVVEGKTPDTATVGNQAKK